MKVLHFIFLAISCFLSTSGYAQSTDRCTPAERDRLGSLNGLYYFDGGTTRRVNTSSSAQLDGTPDARLVFDVSGDEQALRYSPNGRFFLLTDRRIARDGTQVHFGAWPSKTGEEVAVIRRLTQSNAQFRNPTRFVSLSRSDLETMCGSDQVQSGLGDGSVYFRENEYINFHAGNPGNRQADIFKENFHFRWSRAANLCESTNLDDPIDRNLNRSDDEVEDYRLTFTGQPRPQSSTRGEGTISAVAQVLLPKPAFASTLDSDATPTELRTNQNILARVSSTEVSLHRMNQDEERVCISFDAPLPTAFDVRSFLWNRAERTRIAALDLALSGGWAPTQTEIHIQNTLQRDLSMLIRVYWASQ